MGALRGEQPRAAGAAAAESNAGITPLAPGVCIVLFVASGLVLIAGVQLFVLTDYTDSYFAWTITPPLTAAFLGAAYWSRCALEFLAAREKSWARARIAIAPALAFTTLTP